jgi:hypothetical protein
MEKIYHLALANYCVKVTLILTDAELIDQVCGSGCICAEFCSDFALWTISVKIIGPEIIITNFTLATILAQ